MKRIKDLKLKNIKICHTNLDYFRGEFDIGVSLHACGIATDLALNMCYKKRCVAFATAELLEVIEYRGNGD